jgi:hypothetical protein
MVKLTLVPLPGELLISQSPPICTMRSCMLTSPYASRIENTHKNLKTGQELAKHSDVANAIARESEGKRSYPKTHANYWKSRLEHRSYTRDGKMFEVSEWSPQWSKDGGKLTSTAL